MSEVDTLDVLDPNPQFIERDISGQTFYQKPLSFFGKLQFFSVLGTALEKALNDVSVSEILDAPTTDGNLSANDFADADAFLKAISKLVQYAPDLLQNLFVVILAVPKQDIPAALESFQYIDDDQGFEIINSFLDQNGQVMVDFFKKRIQPLVEKIGQTIQSESAPSKPQKRSRQNTA